MPGIYRYCSIFMVFLFISLTSAQGLPGDALVFIWNDTVYATSIAGNELLEGLPRSATGRASISTNDLTITTFEASPLTSPPADGYGFYQGIWSDDRTQFAYLTLEANGAAYRVHLLENDGERILFSGTLDAERGYLVPLGWMENGDLMLLERHMLHNLRDLRLWRMDNNNSEPILWQTMRIPPLSGNSAAIGQGWVFIGLDTVGLEGYLLNLDSLQILTFNSGFALEDPPRSVFEIYPIDVVGIADMNTVKDWIASPQSDGNTPLQPFTPFLYWSLPDYARSITCYPDSEWTDLNFAEECPGLALPRPYEGHQGTDVGGRPQGLPESTPIYAAARGVVIKTYALCPRLDASCNDSYGNIVLMEHSLVRNHNIETWFTGYAHLQAPLVEIYTYINEIGIPIALSGMSGLGGPHLHFEVRSPQQHNDTNWINPWDDRLTGLWIGGNEHPVSAVEAFPPETLLICGSITGSNIRRGPGVTYQVLTQTEDNALYEIFQIQHIEFGEAIGNWYQIRWDNGTQSGWLWSGVTDDCITPEN